MIELVIKISEDSYKATCNGCMLPPDVENIVQGIKNGTPLPKGHGRLIDADELEELFGKECVSDCGACMPKRKTDGKGRWYDTCSLIDKAPTIIEADKEDK